MNQNNENRGQEAGFKSRAEVEGRRYGDDEWVFVRELGQNARDALAGSIDIRILHAEGDAGVSFSDDGEGMTWEHARRYLFRLYASSKERDAFSAGQFGVGFWSVLRFKPWRIEVHSRTDGQGWGVALSGDLKKWERVDCCRSGSGTTVVLWREEADPAGFDSQAGAAVERYLSHLRRAGRRPEPLPVTQDGKRIDQPLRIESPGFLSFKDGDVEGVVGFGDKPSYVLYARGLPVADGDYLEELEGKPVRGKDKQEREGAFPVYLVNGNNLDVVLSRQTVVQDRRLLSLLRTARRRFDELIRRTVDKAVGRSIAGRIFDRVADGIRAMGRAPRWARWSFFLLLMLCVGGTLGAVVAWWQGEGPSPPVQVRTIKGHPPATKAGAGENATLPNPGQVDPDSEPASKPGIFSPSFPDDSLTRLNASTVNPPGEEPHWALTYHPPVPLKFRLLESNRYEPEKGLQKSGSDARWRKPPASGDGEIIEVSIAHPGRAGKWLLPMPSGYVPVRGSGRLGKRRIDLEYSSTLMLRAVVTQRGWPRHGNKSLTFRVRRAEYPERLPEKLSRIPVEWPSDVIEELYTLEGLPLDETIEQATLLIQRLVNYDNSMETAKAYAAAGGKNWVEKVIGLGRGDCDVINGLLVLALRELGVSARLVVGLVGFRGEVLPGTHAWVEVFDEKGMRMVDASLNSGLQTGVAAARPGEHPLVRSPGSGSVPNVARRSPGATGSDRLVFPILAGLAALVVILGIGLVWQLSRTTQKLRITDDTARQRRLLSQLAEEALRRPAAWRQTPGLWTRPFLPCLGGRFVSLAQVIRLSTSDKLFLGTSGATLAEEGVRSGAVVLDASDEVFRKLFGLLSNVRSLDEMADLRPLTKARGLLGALVGEIDRILQKAKVGARCRAVEGLSAALFKDIDLDPIRPRKRSGWARQLLAINPEHPWWQEVSAIYAQRPGVAISMAIDRLAEESWLLRSHAAVLRRRAAGHALRRAE